jgi:hypothetical protein
LLLAIGCLAQPLAARADAEKCAICGSVFGTVVYLIMDEVAEEKKEVCYNCAMLRPRCSTCGLPVFANFTELPDGRSICQRDIRTAVLDPEEAKRVGQETKAELDRLLSRFLAFPETNVTLELVDRVTLQQMFKFPGRDYQCPNVWGFIETTTNGTHLEHAISVLSGLPLDGYKATFAHEHSHAWLHENLSEQRQRRIDRDAMEGFCELVSFMLMEAQNEEKQKKLIQSNAYTRGQVHLFIEARNRFGFDDVLDWMKSGTDSRLLKDDLTRVRNLETVQRPPASVKQVIYTPPELAPAPEALILKGIVWSRNRPLALINDHGFEVREEGRVRLGKTNVVIRCLAISQDSVRIRVVNSGEEQELRLKPPGK